MTIQPSPRDALIAVAFLVLFALVCLWAWKYS